MSLNLKFHAYNLETGIVGYNGATNIVIALKILTEQEYFKSSMHEPEKFMLITVIVRCNGDTIFVIALPC